MILQQIKLLIFLINLLIVLNSGFVPESDQYAPLWHGLKSGSETVGFKVLWMYDHSRTWKNAFDFEGKQLPGESARPIRISVWYPAEKPSDTSPMPFQKYVYLEPNDTSFYEFSKLEQKFEMGGPGSGIRGFFKSQERFDTLLKTPTAAFQNSPIKKGRFPIIVYSVGQNDYTQENVILFEYLASHGYVIATVPHLGTSPRRFNLYINDPLSYETQIRDLEFVIQAMRDFPNVDPKKIAAMGMSQGGIYALLLAMRHPEIKAIVALDSYLSTETASYEFKYWKAPYFDEGRSRAPILFLHKGGSVRYDIAESLKFSDRYFLTFPNLVHGDFTSTPMIVFGTPNNDIGNWNEADLKVRTSETASFGHKVIANYILNFLDAILKGNEASFQFIKNNLASKDLPKGFLEYKYKEGMKGPTEEEYYTIIVEKGLDTAIQKFSEVKEHYPHLGPIREKVLNHIGNELIWAGKTSQAVEVFKLNVVAHPYSSGVYESLAEGYEAMNNKELAIKNYEKTLELNPKNDDARESLKKLKKNN